jgi:hypothetical protein
MASARPSAFKAGGGKLNGVTATLTGYEFGEFPFEAKNPKARKKRAADASNAIFFNASWRVDGAEEDIIDPIQAAWDNEFEVSEDGKTLTPLDDSNQLGQKTNFYRWLATLCSPVSGGDGFPEDDLSEDEINYESVVGHRMRLTQETDEYADKKRGLRKNDKGVPTYHNTRTVVDEYFGVAEVVKPARKVAGKNGQTAASTKSTKAAKGNGHATDVSEDAVRAFADETLARIMAEAKGGTLAKSKLSVKSIMLLADDPRREDVRKLFFDDAYLMAQDVCDYDKAKQVLTLA